MDKTILLLRGLPGSGKTTLATLISIFAGYGIDEHCADYWQTDENGKYDWKPERVRYAHAGCQEAVRTSLKSPNVRMVIVHNTFTQDWEMEPYFDLAKIYNARIFTVIVENRHGSENVHNVPKEIIQKMKDRFEVEL